MWLNSDREEFLLNRRNSLMQAAVGTRVNPHKLERRIKSIPHICHFFTKAKFLENKTYTEKCVNYNKLHSKLPILRVNYDKLHSKLPIFRVKSSKIHTGQFFFTQTPSVVSMTNMRYGFTSSCWNASQFCDSHVTNGTINCLTSNKTRSFLSGNFLPRGRRCHLSCWIERRKVGKKRLIDWGSW